MVINLQNLKEKYDFFEKNTIASTIYCDFLKITSFLKYEFSYKAMLDESNFIC